MKKQFVDRPINVNNKILDRMTAELSPFLNELEIDRIVSFMHTIDTSKFDINYTVDDSATQLRMILGSERYEEVRLQWIYKNQKLTSVYGTKKYKEKSTGKLYDGLDPTDNPTDYEVIYV